MKGFVTTLIKEAGSLLLTKYGPGVAASRKGEMDLVTEADLASQWLIDPLDGTINYFHGYPVFALSIALQRGQETILGPSMTP